MGGCASASVEVKPAKTSAQVDAERYAVKIQEKERGKDGEADAARVLAAAAQPGTMAVSVHDLSGVAYTARVNPTDTVEALRLKVEGAGGPAWRKQRLFTADQRAVEIGTIAENAIEDGQRLNVVLVSDDFDSNENRLELLRADIDVETARDLIRRGVSVNCPPYHYSTTPLYHASSRGDAELVRVLLQYGADATIGDVDSGLLPIDVVCKWTPSNRPQDLKENLEKKRVITELLMKAAPSKKPLSRECVERGPWIRRRDDE